MPLSVVQVGGYFSILTGICIDIPLQACSVQKGHLPLGVALHHAVRSCVAFGANIASSIHGNLCGAVPRQAVALSTLHCFITSRHIIYNLSLL